MEESNVRDYNEKGLALDFQNIIKIARWNYIGIAFIEFLLPYFSKEILNASGTEIGLIISFTLLGVIISSFVTGFLVKKIGSKPLMVIASIGRGITYLAMYFAFVFGSIYALMIAAFIKGAFVGIFEVSFEVLVSDKSHKTRRSYAFGKLISSKGVVLFIGGIIGFVVYGILNYFNQSIFLQLTPMILFSGAMVLTGFRLNLKIKETESDYEIENTQKQEPVSIIEPEFEEPIKKLKSSKGFLIGIILLFISLFLTSVNDFITNPFIQVYLTDVFNSSFWLVLLAYTPGAIVSYILAPQFGKIADKINPYWGISIVSVAGALLTLWLVNVTHIWMFGVIFLLDRGFALTGALLVKSFVSRISIEKRGRNLGFSWSIANIGGIIGPIVGGILYDSYRPAMPFIVSIFVELGLILFYIVGIYKTRNNMEEKTTVGKIDV
jgi:DHA1 family multidrug resistance protein-like MFS transporter